ncbi:P44/Msp2 family outer membrane protein [Candidatus Neoehrlichia procyonis]|uniref:Surface antigen family protein n=1 Tax=Candidatus Neoehrlichia procyonis str. RAC413 TaxID=1359163 RepID=A0A0F3NMY2_9RICK|nr:P44/Msp2 family outer membrane protein [Candidatus Neoehrlichia lotoris]KJV69420.1 surface antigen family protein [Candidatus Neoehrlichia lotoris str. RAC413]
MIYKDLFIKTSFVALALLMPFYSSAQVVVEEESKSNVQNHGFYIGGQYKPGISIMGDLTLKGDLVDIKAIIGLKPEATGTVDADGKTAIGKALETATNFKGIYKPTYNNSLTGFSGLIGYSMNSGMRIEFEGSYEDFELKNPGGYTLKDGYKYFVAAYNLKSGSSDEVDSGSKKYFIIKNSNIVVASTMINACYDFALDSLSNVREISPYLCAGVGGSFVKVFNSQHIKFAYQAKAGVSYFISPSVAIFADGYYEGILNNKFRNFSSYNHESNTSSSMNFDHNVIYATLDFNYFGAEVGVRFTFN